MNKIIIALCGGDLKVNTVIGELLHSKFGKNSKILKFNHPIDVVRDIASKPDNVGTFDNASHGLRMALKKHCGDNLILAHMQRSLKNTKEKIVIVPDVQYEEEFNYLNMLYHSEFIHISTTQQPYKKIKWYKRFIGLFRNINMLDPSYQHFNKKDLTLYELNNSIDNLAALYKEVCVEIIPLFYKNPYINNTIYEHLEQQKNRQPKGLFVIPSW